MNCVTPTQFLPKSDYPVLNEAIKLLRENAYLPLPENNKLEYGMIRGMLQAYNEPHTVLSNRPNMNFKPTSSRDVLAGSACASSAMRKTWFTFILCPIPQPFSPVYREGDRLLKVDDTASPPVQPTIYSRQPFADQWDKKLLSPSGAALISPQLS
jgi:hypothetical protein